MRDLRLKRHPITGEAFETKPKAVIEVDGRSVAATAGESLAAALWANGFFEMRQDDLTGAGRSMYCGIGHCHECRVTVDGFDNIRSCLTPVRAGMTVSLNRPIDEERPE